MLMSPVNPSDLNFVRGTYHSALDRIIWNQVPAAVDRGVYFVPRAIRARFRPMPWEARA
jgi:hypothetical protein